MASSYEGTPIRTGSIGRGFASMDPERQREIASDMRAGHGNTSARPVNPAHRGWMRVQPERDAGMFEGSSSRRSR